MKVSEPLTAKFSSIINKSSANISEEEVSIFNKKLSSCANSDYVKKYLPKVSDENYDLLPIAFESSIINLANENDDAINSISAKGLLNTCADKFINFEHDRSYVIGMTKNVGLHNFSDKSKISEDELDSNDEPVIIAMGGFIWRAVDNFIANQISEQSKDNYFYSLHASWEVSFSEYVLAVGSKKLKDATLITSDEEVIENENI